MRSTTPPKCPRAPQEAPKLPTRAPHGPNQAPKPDLAGERKAHLAEHVRNRCGQNNLEDMFHEHREPSQAFKPKRDILK